MKVSELWQSLCRQCHAAGSAEPALSRAEFHPSPDEKRFGKLSGKSEFAREEFGYGKSNQLAPFMFHIAAPALGSHRLVQAP